MTEVGPNEELEVCPLCGCDLDWADCWDCSGDGGYHDCGEDTCCCADPDDDLNRQCDTCEGRGGFLMCPMGEQHERKAAAAAAAAAEKS